MLKLRKGGCTLIDLISGIFVYALAMLGFDRDFSFIEFGIVVLFAFGPDIDFVLFMLFKKRFGLVSHWLIHFPLLYILVGVGLVGLISDENSGWFFCTTFVLTSLAHFLHDARGVQGVQWLWPLSKKAYAFHGLRFIFVSHEARQDFYSKLRQDAQKRRLWDEIAIRTWRRFKWMDPK